jgi:hypothetical protein
MRAAFISSKGASIPNPYHWIRRAKHGSAFLVPISGDGSIKAMPRLIRRSSAEIDAMKSKQPEVFIRGSLFESHNAAVLVALIGFGERPKSDQDISEAFLDEHGRPFGGAVETLANQASMPAHFFGDSGERELTIEFENLARQFAGPALGTISTMPAWAPDQFDAAMIELFKQYPTPKASWDRLPSTG